MHSKLSTEKQLKKYSLQHVMSTCGNYRKMFDDFKSLSRYGRDESRFCGHCNHLK